MTAYEETGNLHSADPKIQVNALSDQKALTSYVKDICMRCTAMHADVANVVIYKKMSVSYFFASRHFVARKKSFFSSPAYKMS